MAVRTVKSRQKEDTRGAKPGGPYLRINADLIQGLSYKDRDVQSGKTYYYVTRSVAAYGLESATSTETTAKVP